MAAPGIQSLKMAVRRVGLRVLGLLGTRLVDQRTGAPLGRVFFFGWRGRIIAIGLKNEPPLRPVFLPQDRLTYWKQEIGLQSDELPDFPAIAPHAHPQHPADPPELR